jgi:protein-L-isoaspartate(D-aspartate) O-methyltransferase
LNAARPSGRAVAPALPARDRLVAELRRSGVRDEKVLDTIAQIPRHEFVDHALAGRAYENNALPIGHAQTISQPLVVAHMTEVLLNGKRLKKVLEIGTGSGYQTAVLARLVDTVFTVERIKALTEVARMRLARLGCRNVHFGYADGMAGWQPYAPYDGILVTAAAASVAPALIEQLAPGGRLVVPVGRGGDQQLKLIEKIGQRCRESDLGAVSFVPLLSGRA